MDTACSSSLLALDQAVLAIKNGLCEAAIVAGTHICLKPETSLQFVKLNMLSPEGSCKSFDASGNGYSRSEAIVAVYLRKAPVAKRIYATIVHTKNNSDGYKEQGNCRNSVSYDAISAEFQKCCCAVAMLCCRNNVPLGRTATAAA